MRQALPLNRPGNNRLLAALSESDRDVLWLELEFVRLPVGAVLREANAKVTHAYFPLDCVVSWRYVLGDGGAAEIAMTGNEGMAGLSVLLGGDTTVSRSIVQIAGTACRVRAPFLRRFFEQRPGLQRLVLRYAQAMMTQIG